MFARVVAVVTVLAVSACSFGWSHNARPPCNRYYVVPVIDGVIAGSLAYELIDMSSDDHDDPNVLVTAVAIGAVGFAVSAVYGIRQVRRCERGT